MEIIAIKKRKWKQKVNQFQLKFQLKLLTLQERRCKISDWRKNKVEAHSAVSR